jgi:hypothetical protein
MLVTADGVEVFTARSEETFNARKAKISTS